ncbi:MAG: 50S ribosomal protein L18 [Acidobacteria bacterium]|nr:50S ribosomal protein L18 [Acidobacteriota bacterium]
MPRYRTRQERRWRRHRRIRKNIQGTAARPRIAVFRSLRHVYAQAIDDERGHTLAAASTLEKTFRVEGRRNATVELARQVGELLAQRLATQGIQRAVFDRAGFKFHGQVRAVCEGLRAKGIQV